MKKIWKRTWNKLGTLGMLLIGALILAVLSWYLLPGISETQQPEETQAAEVIRETVAAELEVDRLPDINEVGMQENKSIYSQDDPDSLVYFYVTVQRGDAGSDTDHSFAEVNSVVRFVDDSHYVDDVYARAIVQVGDASGPQPGMLGYGATKANASIRVRGNSSSVMPQKSYKLALDDEAGLWRGQSNIALNKHIFDSTRIRNKLYYDLLRPIENISSLRTQFVRLFIKDETAGETAYTDYGLFTQVEVPNKKYLANHGLDSEGYLYKAISFNFEMSDGLKNFDDPDFDQAAFDAILDCKGYQDNQKLIDLVNMIADRNVDIDEIVGSYIDRENYLTWMAYNILTANIDTTMQNFYLYSPLNSQKWFFIPWDSDTMLYGQERQMEGSDKDYGGWEHGISNYWGALLHQRFLKKDANRQALADKVDELYQTINKQSVDSAVQMYDAVARPYVLAMPDIYHLSNTVEERDVILAGMGDQLEKAYQAFYDSLEELMPFFMYAPEYDEATIRFSWEDAYDFSNERITYDLTVARTPQFTDPIIQVTGLESTEYQVDVEPYLGGTWYYRVTAHTASGKTSKAMNKIQVNGVYYPGVDVAEVSG